MTLKRRSTISTGNNDKKLDTSKKSMKNLKKESTWKILPTSKPEPNELAKLLRSKQIDKLR